MRHRAGTECECELPEGYDDRTRIAMSSNGKIIVVHPDFVPCFVEEGKLVEITMPTPADRPLRKVTLNLYEEDCLWAEKNIGHGWTQWVRTEINAEIARLKEMNRKRRTLGEL